MCVKNRHMDTSNCVNSVGLVLDILGALVIFAYGLPRWVVRDTDSLVIDAGMIGQDDKKLYKDPNTRWNRLGLTLLIVGFTLQLASNFIPPRVVPY